MGRGRLLLRRTGSGLGCNVGSESYELCTINVYLTYNEFGGPYDRRYNIILVLETSRQSQDCGGLMTCVS